VTSERDTEPDGTPAPVFPSGSAADAAAPGTPPDTAPAMPPDAAGTARRPAGVTRYRVLLSLLFILSCVGILTSTVVVWVHQVALNTDRWVEVVGPLPEDPDVRLAVSTKVASRVVTALDIQGRLEAVLPGPADIIAAPISNQIEQGLQTRLEGAMATPEFQTAWVAANRLAHQQVVDILRGQSETVYVREGYVVLDVWPLVGIALEQLQAQGIIPATVALPDLSQGLPPGSFDRLNAVLGGRIPADLGTVPLVPADKLEQAQRVVSVFDWITVLLIVLTVVLIAVTIWYSARRRRTIALLALGGAIALVLARFAIQSLEGALVSSITDANTATILRDVATLAINDLYGFTRIVIFASVIVAIVAYLSGRPAWATQLAGRASEATGRAATGAGAPAQSGSAGAPSRETVGGWARANRRTLNWIGIGAIAFILLWIMSGFWVALLGTALIGLLEFGLGLLGEPKGEPSASTAGPAEPEASDAGSTAGTAGPPAGP
jgi:hypothetical protein